MCSYIQSISLEEHEKVCDHLALKREAMVARGVAFYSMPFCTF
jgi:hypothetical protein